MIKTYSFPSVYESTLRDFATSNDPILGFSKLKFEGVDYLVGLHALNDGVSPHKFINPMPEDLDYKIITQAALVVANNALQSEVKNGRIPKMIITTGFPYATYQFNKEAAEHYLKDEKIISYFKSSDDGILTSEQRIVSISEVNIIPELVGCDTAVRKGENPLGGNFLIISLGYGTCEGAVSTPEGLSVRTLFSTHGISYAVNLFSQELSKHTYLSMRTEHQVDHLFTKGFMYVNRKRRDLSNEKKMSLEMYYNNVVSPAIRRYISDQDFESVDKLVLAGGGANHKDLLEMFRKEFGELLNITVFENPEKCASTGYALYSKLNHSVNEKDGVFSTENPDKPAYLGIDIGNANTSVAVYHKSTAE